MLSKNFHCFALNVKSQTTTFSELFSKIFEFCRTCFANLKYFLSICVVHSTGLSGVAIDIAVKTMLLLASQFVDFFYLLIPTSLYLQRSKYPFTWLTRPWCFKVKLASPDVLPGHVRVELRNPLQ